MCENSHKMFDDAPRTTVTPQELRSRAVYSLLLPAVRLAGWLGIPLKEVQRWLQLAYFRELRGGGRTLQETADALGVAMRTAAELSRRLKDNFFLPERDHELPRRVEFMLWAEPASRARLCQVLDAAPADVDAAIDRLIAEQRIRLADDRPDVFEVTSTQARLVKPSWMARIDGVNNLMRNVAAATYDRVLDQSPLALLRTLSFRIARDDVAELKALYEEHIFPRLAALEERAVGREDAITMDFSVLWAPEADRTSPPLEDEP